MRVECIKNNVRGGGGANVECHLSIQELRGNQHPDGRRTRNDDRHCHRLKEQRVAGDPES